MLPVPHGRDPLCRLEYALVVWCVKGVLFGPQNGARGDSQRAICLPRSCNAVWWRDFEMEKLQCLVGQLVSANGDRVEFGGCEDVFREFFF
jgi:hypothetical protein